MSPMELDLLPSTSHPATPGPAEPQQDQAWLQIARRFGLETGIEQACATPLARCAKPHLSVIAPLTRSDPPLSSSDRWSPRVLYRLPTALRPCPGSREGRSAPQRLLDPSSPAPGAPAKGDDFLPLHGGKHDSPMPLAAGAQGWGSAPGESPQEGCPT